MKVLKGMNDLEKKAKNNGEEIKETEIPEETAEEIKTEEPAVEEAPSPADEYKDKLLRTMAEFENFKKRTQAEKEALYEYSVADVIGKILPVIDTLKLSLTHADEKDPVRQGVELTIKQFDEVFAKLNVTEIPALGETFDPNFHNAVLHIDDDAYGSQEIVEVLQSGYKINEKVIRYSMVKVAN